LHHRTEPGSIRTRIEGAQCWGGADIGVRSLRAASQNLKAPFRLAVDTPEGAHYSHVLPAAPEAWFPSSVPDRVFGV
jgi:hypothetical protein